MESSRKTVAIKIIHTKKIDGVCFLSIILEAVLNRIDCQSQKNSKKYCTKRKSIDMKQKSKQTH